MRTASRIALVLAAGTCFSVAANAQPTAGKAGRVVTHKAGARTVSTRVDGVVYPDHVRSVRLFPDGHVEPLSAWSPYTPPSNHGDLAIQYVFDCIQDNPGVLPGTLPTTGRYRFQWTTGAHDYQAAMTAAEMAGIPAAARGQGAKICDILFDERAPAGTPLYITVGTAETYSTTTPPDASWGGYPAIQLQYATGAGTGFWFTSADVSTQPPPIGDGWKMPTDGNGAYIIRATRDAAATQVAQQFQSGRWGTGEHAQPPVARVGTQQSLEWTDDSTPPVCGASGLVDNIPNGILDSAACELADWTFAVPAPNPTVLSPAIGFGMDVGTTPPPCYANCDGSTVNPILNVNDFICFQTKYAQNDTYANCDGSTVQPILNVNDFICFQTKYAQGCP